MRSKDPEKMKNILAFADEYIMYHHSSPSITQIAEGVGIARGTAYKYLVEMRDRGMLTYDGRTITTERTRRSRPDTVRAAILGEVACGLPQLAEENIEGYVQLPEAVFGTGCMYILRARGDSMVDAGIADGDLVVVREQQTAENGEIVVALVGDEATLKRFYREDGRIRLHPENSGMDDIFVDDCAIQGVAVSVIRRF
jgi:repressor LexA